MEINSRRSLAPSFFALVLLSSCSKILSFHQSSSALGVDAFVLSSPNAENQFSTIAEAIAYLETNFPEQFTTNNRAVIHFESNFTSLETLQLTSSTAGHLSLVGESNTARASLNVIDTNGEDTDIALTNIDLSSMTRSISAKKMTITANNCTISAISNTQDSPIDNFVEVFGNALVSYIATVGINGSTAGDQGFNGGSVRLHDSVSVTSIDSYGGDGAAGTSGANAGFYISSGVGTSGIDQTSTLDSPTDGGVGDSPSQIPAGDGDNGQNGGAGGNGGALYLYDTSSVSQLDSHGGHGSTGGDGRDGGFAQGGPGGVGGSANFVGDGGNGGMGGNGGVGGNGGNAGAGGKGGDGGNIFYKAGTTLPPTITQNADAGGALAGNFGHGGSAPAGTGGSGGASTFGSPGLNGADGSDGTVGTDGASALDGAAGADGTITLF